MFDEVNAVAYDLIQEHPRTFAELGPALYQRFDQHRPDELCRMARSGLALVQVPPRGLWGQSGPSRHAILQTWLGTELPAPDPQRFIERYLAAFGPASAADVAAWSGLTGVGKVVSTMELTRHHTEAGRELFDLPTGVIIDEATPAPVTILAEFDNILLGHADRNRIFDDEHRLKFMSQNGLVASTLLVDGFVGGHCKMDRAKNTLTIQPYQRLTSAVRRAVIAEAERILACTDTSHKGEVTVQPV